MDHPFSRRFAVDTFEARLRRLTARESFRFPASAVPSTFKRSSVLICFWRDGEDARVLLTKRAASLRGHPGQMSFPGGHLEPGEAWIDAALRETEEEVGIQRDRIEVLGRLDDAWSGAGHLLVPVVGWLPERPEVQANPDEVAEIHTPSVSALFAASAYASEEARIGETVFTNRTLHWPEGNVYGLSSDLLIEAVQWGIGIETTHGPGRLESLEAYLRHKEAERRNQADGPGETNGDD